MRGRKDRGEVAKGEGLTLRPYDPVFLTLRPYDPSFLDPVFMFCLTKTDIAVIVIPCFQGRDIYFERARHAEGL